MWTDSNFLQFGGISGKPRRIVGIAADIDDPTTGVRAVVAARAPHLLELRSIGHCRGKAQLVGRHVWRVDHGAADSGSRAAETPIIVKIPPAEPDRPHYFAIVVNRLRYMSGAVPNKCRK